MHAKWLVDAAALVSYHCPTMVEYQSALPRNALYKYWSTSRQRFDQWHETLGQHRTAKQHIGISQQAWLWRQLQPTIDEILLGDIVARCLCGVAASLESRNIDLDASPITTSVLSGQDECRNRVLDLMQDCRGLSTEQIVQMNRVRHALEQWTDTLLMTIDHRAEVLAFRFDNDTSLTPSQAIEIDDDQGSRQRRQLKWRFMMAGAQQWIDKNCTSVAANQRLNHELHRCLHNMIKPEWMEHMLYENLAEQFGCEQLVGQVAHLVSQLDQVSSQPHA